MSEKFPASWIHGAENCLTSTDPAFQIHRFDESTYIIRQSKCLNFEGPFLYLLAGEDTAFLFDSGATPVNDAPLPIREAVDSILKEILESRGQPPERRISLIVGHTHAHADHLAGDRCLQSRPGTVIIPPTLQGLKRFFSIRDWSNDLGTLELGSRRLTIIPTPGHEDLHICIYDSQTKILLSGDILYPGKLVINDWTAYRKSAEKLYKFSLENEISYILGAHIEMKNTPGELYEIGTTFQPDEHSLELKPEHLTEWATACRQMGDNPQTQVHDSFILWLNR